jgi:chorismate mutase
MTMLRGVRGAITVDRDEREVVLFATERLLKATPDLTSAFPAVAARRIGWTFVPLLNFTEIDVVGGLARCVHVLVHLNTDLRQDQIVHVFLEGARVLRPGLVVHRQQRRTRQL